MSAHTFTDPISRSDCIVHLADGEQGDDFGIEHPDCEYRAEVFPTIDAFYCTHCKMNGRISGSWFMHLLADWTYQRACTRGRS